MHIWAGAGCDPTHVLPHVVTELYEVQLCSPSLQKCIDILRGKKKKKPQLFSMSEGKVGIFQFPVDKAIFEQNQISGPHKLPHCRTVVVEQSALIMN